MPVSGGMVWAGARKMAKRRKSSEQGGLPTVLGEELPQGGFEGGMLELVAGFLEALWRHVGAAEQQL